MPKPIPSLLVLTCLFSIHAADRRAVSDIRVNVNMTLVPVSVTDNYGRNVTGLAPQNFRVFDGTRQVPIASFSRLDQPITVGLVFDCSGSMKEKFRIAREAPGELFKQLNADDDSFLVTVSTKAELRQKLTPDFGELENALLFSHPDGTTSLLDGVYLALQQVRKSHNQQKAIVIVSDGGENNSRYSMHELTRLAVESDTQIFAAGIFDKPQSQEEEDGPALLTDLCGRTGGVNFVIHNVADLSNVMSKIGVTLHNQYMIGYYPPQADSAGKYRKIRVQLLLPSGLPPLQVHARGGYYVRD